MRFVVALNMEEGVEMETRGDGADDCEEEGGARTYCCGGVESRIEEGEMNVGIVEESDFRVQQSR